jgi:hypothetical protein
VTGVWTQGFTLAKQEFTAWTKPLILRVLVIFVHLVFVHRILLTCSLPDSKWPSEKLKKKSSSCLFHRFCVKNEHNMPAVWMAVLVYLKNLPFYWWANLDSGSWSHLYVITQLVPKARFSSWIHYSVFGLFETGSHCVSQAGFELMILLLQPPKC